MSTKTSDSKPIIYDTSEVYDIRCIRRRDGISFMASFLEKPDSDAIPISVGVELRLTNQHGALAITMRRVARKPDSWHCSTSTIRLPPQAAADLARSLIAIAKHLKK